MPDKDFAFDADDLQALMIRKSKQELSKYKAPVSKIFKKISIFLVGIIILIILSIIFKFTPILYAGIMPLVYCCFLAKDDKEE
jgi:ABC-type polysaccharide/polyol phosphate export permease